MNTLEVVIDKLVHGGQALGTAPDGRKVFVWNALPGERVLVELRKSKNKYLEGIAIDILESSADRVAPLDEAYLSTSPWQMMTFEAENRYKQEILAETFQREHVTYDQTIAFHSGRQQWHYRNKMEYSFWGDDDGLHLALFHRASHGKRIITGSSIAMPAIDETARNVRDILNERGIRAGDLKTVIVRCTQSGDSVAALFVKREDFPEIPELAHVGAGAVVYYSNLKSPASVATRQLYTYGQTVLTDIINDVPIKYGVTSFFQVNLPVFAAAASNIRTFLAHSPEKVDMYAGVGTLALLTGATRMVEIDMLNTSFAEQNATNRSLDIVLAPTERAIEHITASADIIVDPPRAGLHQDVIGRLREVQPQRIAYLSCNPITQARDIALLQDVYNLSSLEGYNFFPRTPHIESLALLTLKA